MSYHDRDLKNMSRTALRESVKPKSIFEHTLFSGFVLAACFLIAMTIENWV